LRLNVLALVDVPEAVSLSRGHLVDILGICGDWAAEKKALQHQYHIIKWEQGFTISIPNHEARPFVRGFTFNIDPPGCKDIDDVFTLGDDGTFTITIADVAHWMKDNPESFREAQKRGQTAYSPEGAIEMEMIPFQKECSLLPGHMREGISLQFRVVDGQIVDPTFLQTCVVNNKSYTYETCDTRVCQTALVVATHIGRPMKDPGDSHEWVETLMLFYNMEAAKFLKQKRAGLLRHHDPPDEEKLLSYSNLTDVQFLAYKSAHYVDATEPAHHWGLGALYCHATSPIRRFADIVNQFALKGMLPPGPVSIVDVNAREKELKRYSRDSFFLSRIQETERKVSGVVMSHRVWVPGWKRMVTCRTDLPPGTRGTLEYSLDMTQSTWKRRMVFKFTANTTA
jgi:exoribonuclease R